MTAIKELEAYSAANYEAGGHWVFECYDVADYQEALDEVGGDVARAKANLKAYWELVCDRERDCQWG